MDYKNKNERLEFVEVMNQFSLIYGFKELSQDGLRLYFKLLQNYEIVDIKKASIRMMQERVWDKFPNPAEFIQFLENKTKVDDDQLKLQAEDEFQQVLRGISRAGYMNPIFFDNGITGACVRDIGWNKLCQMTNDEMTWIKKEFISGYIACYKQNRTHNEVINKCNGDLKVIKSNINNVEMIEYKPEERSNQTLKAIEYRGNDE